MNNGAGTFDQWLVGAGLGAHIATFAANSIDLDIASTLSDADLRELGLNLGDRKRFLNAVARLTPIDASAPSAEAAPQSTPAADGRVERRQLTILFCDLVGSTSLSQRLDPERLRELMQTYQQTCRQVIEKYEGHVAQYLGDGLMVYFGFPRAHEDDAERAVRSALDIVNAVSAIPSPDAPLQVRIGIATGPVVVGETGSGDASVPKLAVGETPNVAARLQGLAGPDEIVIAPFTHRLVGSMFEMRDRGQQVLKGIVEPVHAWQVLRLARVEDRFAASRGEAALTPWIGRESELALLWNRWRQACEGEGQLVLVSGEPGIGKSRIAQALRERIGEDDHHRMNYQCSTFHRQSALYPVTDHLERAAGFQREDSIDQRLDKLEALLGGHATDEQSRALFASLLSLPVQRYPALNFSPQKQKDLLLSALMKRFAQLTADKPVLMVIEDAHWADPTTHDLLDLLITGLPTMRALVILTYRPEYSPRWSGEAHLTHLALSRLNRRLAAQLAQRVSGGKPLPPEVVEQIVAKTDGVPLFVEELTKSVLESDLLRETPSHYELRRPMQPFAIPNTLHDSLMARLDRLPAVKELAQMAACIGREFSFELMAAIADRTSAVLGEGLEQLVNAGLIFRHGAPPQAVYTFKHALVQDVAYESLLKSRRQQLHSQLVRALETQFAERAEADPSIIAMHCAASGMQDKAAHYWHAAAQQALNKFANAEAKEFAVKGLDALSHLPESEARDQQELVLRIAFGTAQFSVRGYAGTEVFDTYARARELSARVGDSPHRFLVMFGLWVFYFVRAEFGTSEEFCRNMEDIGRKLNDPIFCFAADVMGVCQYTPTGNLRMASDRGKVAIANYDSSQSAKLRATFGTDVSVGAFDWASWSTCLLGYPETAVSLQNTALDMARRQGEPNNLAQVLAHTSIVDYFRNDAQAANEHAQGAIKVSEAHGIPLRLAEGHIVQGWARSELGDAPDSLQQIERGVDAWNQTGARIANPIWYSMLARAYWKHGDLVKARQWLDRAMSELKSTGEAIWEAELHRLDGEMLLAEGIASHSQAEERFHHALSVARSQQARLLELRIVVSLVKLWRSQGRRSEGDELLQPLYAWFTEGFDNFDLRQAKALIR